MSRIRLCHQNGYAWTHVNQVYAKGFVITDEGILREEALCAFFESCATKAQLLNRLQKTNGMFSVIIQQDAGWLAAVDRLRCFPLFYRKKDNQFIVSDEVDALFDDEENKNWNTEAIQMFSATGYAIGEDTLIDGISQIQAGEMVFVQEASVSKDFYYRFADEPDETVGEKDAERQLKDVLDRVGSRLVQLLDGRTVAVPLSGGLDSRLIVYLLHKFGYQNVVCFTYGKKQHNDEWCRSKRVAEQYGYPWLFIDYETVDAEALLQDEVFLSYVRYAAQYTSKFYLSEYVAARYFAEHDQWGKELVFVPGHSGDMIAGSHLRPYMSRYRNVSQVVKDLTHIHFNLVETTSAERRMFHCKVRQQLEDMGPVSFSGLLETWDVRERQAKYIVNSCKVWEYFGFKYLLPLWDAELTDFFSHLPLDMRMCKHLYENVLWNVFSGDGILFEEDKKMCLPSGWKENVKLWVKRNIPQFHTRSGLFVQDSIAMQRLTSAMQGELAKSGHTRTMRSYNAIVSEWYLNSFCKKSK